MTEIITQAGTTYPTRPERLYMLFLAVMLILNLAASIRAATYTPDCVPVVIESEESE